MVTYFCCACAGEAANAITAAAKIAARLVAFFMEAPPEDRAGSLSKRVLRSKRCGNSQRCRERHREPGHQFVELCLFHDEGWCEENVIALLPIDRAAHGIAHQSRIQRRLFQPRM